MTRSLHRTRTALMSASIALCATGALAQDSEPTVPTSAANEALENEITPEMNAAYVRLHELGYAHSVETWHAGQLVGGLYGVALGGVFYGESMFTRMSDASKVALVGLAAQLQHWQFGLIDCQMHTRHLLSLGAEDISRRRFLRLLERHAIQRGMPGLWRFETLPMAPNGE